MKSKITAMILALAAAGAALAQNGLPDRLVQAAQERELAMHAGRLNTDERITFFQSLAAAQPAELRYQNMLALANIQKTRETQDFAYLDRAALITGEVLAKDAENYEALRVRSQIYLERHDFKRAAENASRLISSHPQDPYNYGVLGDALIEQGQYEKAADAYQKMVNLRPDLSSYNRASYYRYLLGDANGAIEAMRAAIKAGNPSMPESIAWCLVQLGNMQFQQGRLPEAGQAYEEALLVFPNHYEALAGLGKVAAAREKLDDAIGYMKKSVSVVPFLDNVALLADYYELAGSKQQAEEQWKLVEFIDRLAEINKEVFNRNLAMAYANHDMRPEKALQLALRELDARGDIYTWDATAWAYYKEKKYKEASDAMQKAVQLGTPDPMLHYHAGMIARAMGRDAEARKELARALELNPRFDARQSRLAQAALRELSAESSAGGGQ